MLQARERQPRHLALRIEHAQPDPRFKETLHGNLDLFFRDQPLLHRSEQIGVHSATVEVAPVLDRHRGIGGASCSVCAIFSRSDMAPISASTRSLIGRFALYQVWFLFSFGMVWVLLLGRRYTSFGGAASNGK